MEKDAQRTIEAALGRRVYEYVSDDGTVYWSFTRHPSRIGPMTRLRLRSWIGTHLVTFLSQIRTQGQELALGRYDDTSSSEDEDENI